MLTEIMLFVWTDHCSHGLCGCDDLQPHNVHTLYTHTGEGIYVTQFGLTSSWEVKHPPCTLLTSSQDRTISE